MFTLTRDVHEFAMRTQGFLHERIDCNVMSTLLGNAVDGVFTASLPLFAYRVNLADEVDAAAMRIPPWPLLTSALDATAAGHLMGEWLLSDPRLPGVNALVDTARAISTAWARLTGGSTRCTLREGMHSLEEVVDPPRPAAGTLRVARVDQRPLLVEWLNEFTSEVAIGRPAEAEGMVDARLRHGGMLLWDDGGPACLVGLTRPIGGVVRIGPVYTPPPRRRKGYAGTAVAAASRIALERGAQRCMLYTDLANPTANKIYAEVGYRRFADWEEHDFAV